MAGVVSPSMWMFELHDEVHDNTSWCSLNEGLGKVLRYGAYSSDVIERLRWMAEVLGPALQGATRARGPVDILAIVAQMVQMGDEGHNRNRAGTLMLLKEWLPDLITSGSDPADVAEVVRFISGNDHFFLNLVMPACKLMTVAASGIPGSSVVTTMARNGTDFGIQVSRHRRHVVRRSGPDRRRSLPRAVRPRRRQPRHRRLGDHGDGRRRRVRDGDGPRDRAVRRRVRAGRAQHDAADVRHLRG